MVVLSLPFFFSCTGSPPGIINTDWMLVYTDDLVLGAVYEELNFYVQVQDRDGDNDLTEIYLIRNDLNWSWKIDSSNWVSYDQDGEHWLGANGLSIGTGGNIPRGDYRVLVIDRSGQRDERTITIRQPGIDSGKLNFPEITKVGATLRIRSDVAPVLLWFYNSQSELLTEKYTATGTFPLSDFLNEKEQQQVTWFYAYYQNEVEGYGIKSGPYLFDSDGP